MSTNSSDRRPEMSQSQQPQAIVSPNTPTFPISAYLPEKRSSGHANHSPDDRERRSSRYHASRQQDSQSSDWSKGSEKGRDSVDLGRPVSEGPLSPPPRTVNGPVRPESLRRDLVIDPFSSPTPTSPRSGHTKHMNGALRTIYDSEKLASPLSPASRRSRLDSVTSILEDSYCRCRRKESEDTLLETKALNILIYLSFPNILVSFILLVWTLVAILSTLILSPFRICSSGSAAQSLTSFLIPPLRLQHAIIYSSRLSHTASCRHSTISSSPSRHAHSSQISSANSSPSPCASANGGIEYGLGMLVMVHLLSPLMAVGVAFAAWTAAVFWFYAAIIGDPSGSDKPMGYNDGKSSVLGVRAWWAHWLARPVKGK